MNFFPRLFVAYLVTNFLVETLAALSLIAGPGGLVDAGQGNQWSMHYGFAALSIASASLWVWPYRNDAAPVTMFLGIALVFHTGVCVSLTAAGDQAAGMVLHGVFAIVGLALFLTRSRWLASADQEAG